MTAKDELRPCPFCGYEAMVIPAHKNRFGKDVPLSIECGSVYCGASQCCKNEAATFERWNYRVVDRRASPASPTVRCKCSAAPTVHDLFCPEKPAPAPAPENRQRYCKNEADAGCGECEVCLSRNPTRLSGNGGKGTGEPRPCEGCQGRGKHGPAVAGGDEALCGWCHGTGRDIEAPATEDKPQPPGPPTILCPHGRRRVFEGCNECVQKPAPAARRNRGE